MRNQEIKIKNSTEKENNSKGKRMKIFQTRCWNGVFFFSNSTSKLSLWLIEWTAATIYIHRDFMLCKNDSPFLFVVTTNNNISSLSWLWSWSWSLSMFNIYSNTFFVNFSFNFQYFKRITLDIRQQQKIITILQARTHNRDTDGKIVPFLCFI